MAGGGSSDVSLLMDPSRLAGYGLDATAPLTQKLADLGMTDLSDLLVFELGYLAILGCFLIMAINVFLAVLEYYLFVALVGILLPFGVFGPTKFLAEKAVGAVVAAGVKLMTLAFLTAAVEPVIRNIHFAGPEITLNELWSMFLTICSLMLLCWKAPSLAASLLAGSPNLGHGDAFQAGQTAVLAGAAVAHAVMGNGGGAAQAATKAAASAGEGRSAGATPSASSLGSGLSSTPDAGGRASPKGSPGSGAATAPSGTPGASPGLVMSSSGPSQTPPPPATPSTGATA
jgi:type IV secretion system protein TrbL